MPGRKKKGKKRPAHIQGIASQKREAIEIEQLCSQVLQAAPPLGSQEATAAEFAELPLSRYTQKGACHTTAWLRSSHS